jgi:hypothetical protein
VLRLLRCNAHPPSLDLCERKSFAALYSSGTAMIMEISRMKEKEKEKERCMLARQLLFYFTLQIPLCGVSVKCEVCGVFVLSCFLHNLGLATFDVDPFLYRM